MRAALPLAPCLFLRTKESFFLAPWAPLFYPNILVLTRRSPFLLLFQRPPRILGPLSFSPLLLRERAVALFFSASYLRRPGLFFEELVIGTRPLSFFLAQI